MSSSSGNQGKANLKSGTVYKRTAAFLDSNVVLDPEPTKIESKNTITNPFTNKKKRRYIDTIGDALAPSLSSSISGRCYDKLRKLEQDVDVSIARRHCHIANQLQNASNERNVSRILRLECYNTFHPDPVDPVQSSEWRFKLQTKLFDPKDLSRAISSAHRPMESLYYDPLQALISRIEFRIEGVDSEVVEWNNPNWTFHGPTHTLSGNRADGIEIARKGNTDRSMEISLYLTNWLIPFEHQPGSKKKGPLHSDRNALCKVSGTLSELLGLEMNRYHRKWDILQLVSRYCSDNKLIRKDHSMAIDCDEALTAVMGSKVVWIANVWKSLVLKKQVLPPDPIHIRHNIRVSGAISENAKIYDVLVKVPSLTAMRASKLMESVHDKHTVDRPTGMQMTIDALNVQISDVLEEIADQTREGTMLEEYAKDPVSTIDVLVSNQRENLQIIKEFAENAGAKTTDYFAHSSIYGDIKHYLEERQFEAGRKANNEAKDNR